MLKLGDNLLAIYKCSILIITPKGAFFQSGWVNTVSTSRICYNLGRIGIDSVFTIGQKVVILREIFFVLFPDIENWIFTGGIKTEAGENRPVPIHSRIRPLVERKYKEAQELGSQHLINDINPDNKRKNIKLTYSRYQNSFNRIRDELTLNPDHRPHDGRKHFVTAAKKYGVDEYAIKYMVGHKISDITEKVYTEREFAWLKEEMEKLK